MTEERPLKLHFFVSETADKLLALCKREGIEAALSTDGEGNTWEGWVTTVPLKATQRRNLISKWASVSMERIG